MLKPRGWAEKQELWEDKQDQSTLRLAGSANNLSHYCKSNGKLLKGSAQEHHVSSLRLHHFGLDVEKSLGGD